MSNESNSGSKFTLINGSSIQAPFSAFGILGQVGCDIVKQEDDSISINLTDSGLSRAQSIPYLDGLREIKGVTAKSASDFNGI